MNGNDLYHPGTTVSKLVEKIVKDSKIETIKEIVKDEQKRDTGKLPPLPSVKSTDDTDIERDSIPNKD